MGFYTGNYASDASFRYEVYPGVAQVPINTLGKPHFTNEEAAEISRLPLGERRERIGNLFEAIQLFQASGFRGVFDNTDCYIGDVHWQTHKSPESAVVTNEGCCATDTNWLAYFLKGRYDSLGSFCFGHPDQNGHITTCIRQGTLYYFIDMMMCRRDSQAFLDREDIAPSERQKRAWEGYLYVCGEPLQMCRFYIDRFRAAGRCAPYCFYMREAVSVTATGCGQDKNGVVKFYAPECDRPRLLYLDPALDHGFSVVPLPDGIPTPS